MPYLSGRGATPGTEFSKGDNRMEKFLTEQYIRIQTFLADERGQDLIEYALVVALIAFAAVAGMNTVATDINLAFSRIGSKLESALT